MQQREIIIHTRVGISVDRDVPRISRGVIAAVILHRHIEQEHRFSVLVLFGHLIDDLLIICLVADEPADSVCIVVERLLREKFVEIQKTIGCLPVPVRPFIRMHRHRRIAL